MKLRTKFICSIGNEAVLKSLFKIKDDDFMFTKAVEVTMETEDAAKASKETVHDPHASGSNTLIFRGDQKGYHQDGRQLARRVTVCKTSFPKMWQN